MNHIVFSKGPDKTYTRHSEGAFLRLKNGEILFVYSRFTGTHEDDAPSDLVAMRSKDEGETWSEAEVAIPASLFGVENVMSTSLLRMQNGDVGLFYIVKLLTGNTHIYLSRSNDEGRTFYRHVRCSLTDREGYYVLNNHRVERLESGRIIVPLAFHRGGYNTFTQQSFFDGRSFDVFLYSDDDGETWQESPDTVSWPFMSTFTGLQEPGIIEKKNGVLWGYARTDKMYQYEFFSMDGGLHWTAAQPSRFTSPDSPMKIVRRPENGDLYAIWNPIPKYNGRYCSKAGWGRTPFVYAVSHDDGVTWGELHTIEDDPEHGYCYPGVFFTKDNAMLVSYCSGGPADDYFCLSRLTIQKIELE